MSFLHLPPDAALFDLDGTLIRTHIDFPGMRKAMQDLSARYGTTDATESSDDTLDIVERMATALGGSQGQAVRQEAFAILEEIEEEGCRNGELIPGAADLLLSLRSRDVKIGIITRNCRRVSEAMLKRTGLPHDVLIAREDTPQFKPHPEPLLLALRQFDVPPHRATMTGDLWTDIAAGKAAGVGLTVGIQWPYDPPQRFARCPPDIEVDSLTTVLPLLLPADHGD